MKHYYRFLAIAILLSSCVLNRNNYVIKKAETKNDVITTIIEDFSKTKKGKKHKAYYIIENTDSANLYSFTILDHYINYVNKRDTIGAATRYFPTQFKEINNRLYLWNDPNVRISNSVISIMQQYKVIDSIIYKIETGKLPQEATPTYTTNELKKYLYYYVCKNNIHRFKKIYSNKNLKLAQYPDSLCSETDYKTAPTTLVIQ